jgi:hypothetical protein
MLPFADTFSIKMVNSAPPSRATLSQARKVCEPLSEFGEESIAADMPERVVTSAQRHTLGTEVAADGKP